MTGFESPIKQLYDQIVAAYELWSEPTRNRLYNAFTDGIISNEIYISPEWTPIIPPRANLFKREIQLHGTFLEYLWVYCYTMIGIEALTYDYTIAKGTMSLQEAKSRTDEFDFMIAWAVELNKRWTPWNDNIPKPCDTSDRVKMSNELFLHAVRYLMYHETCHLLWHSTSISFIAQIKTGRDISPEDSRRYRNMEMQADTFAYEALFEPQDSVSSLYIKTLGALIAHLSSFLLLPNLNMSNEHHPAMDARLKSVLSKVKGITEPFYTYIHLTVTMGLQMFISQHDKEFVKELAEHGVYETFEDLEETLFEFIRRNELA